jgi:predicted dehydrogenase
MASRRSFLIGSALTAAASRSAVGANDRIRAGFIGVGTRGGMMATLAEKNEDCQILAMCDVYKRTLDQAVARLKLSKPDTYSDYRRVLERKDIDAVYVATPDHWHAPMIVEATQAGKDVYCEKPLSNNIEAAVKAVDAVKKYKRIVQIGLQQRSWDHFQKCAELVQSGMFGTIFHCKLHWSGHYCRAADPPSPVPEGLDWELFQGPAPRRPFSQNCLFWRSYYDYGGGIITDQGVHINDVVCWYMKTRVPISVSAEAQYVQVQPPNLDNPPDSFQIAVKYDKFVMSYTNAYFPQTDYAADQGNYFYGTRGALHVNRQSYTYRTMPGRGGAARGGTPPPPPFEPVNEKFAYVGGPSDAGHIRNWLDCVKSRETPRTDVETGFYSTLPLLMGLLAIRNGKTYNWDDKARVVRI